MAITQTFTSNGVLKVFTISEFDFLRSSDLKVYIDPTGGTAKTLVLENTGAQAGQYTIDETAKTITFISSNIQGTLQTNDGSGNAGAPLAGVVTAERITSVSSPINTFQAGSAITASALNDSLNQLRFNIEEYGTLTNSGSLSDTDKGDITVSSSGNTWTIDNGAVTSAKLDTNIDIAGTLDVTSNTVFDANVNIKGDNKTFTIEKADGTDKFTVASQTGNTTIAGNTTISGTLTSSTLTDNRVLFGGTAGLIEDSANLTFDGTTLTVTGAAAVDNITIDGSTISTSSGDVTINPASELDITTNVTNFKNPGGTVSLEVGTGATGDHTAHIDLISDSTNTDYGGRIIRAGGANGGLLIKNKGSGSIDIAPEDAGDVRLYHSSSALKIQTTAGGCTVTGSVTETSDIALKEDIQPLSNSLANLKQLNGYSYKFKDTGAKALGLTAQEVEKVYPDLVEGEEGKKGLHYSGLIAPLLEAIKELSTEVETLKTKVAALEAA